METEKTFTAVSVFWRALHMQNTYLQTFEKKANILLIKGYRNKAIILNTLTALENTGWSYCYDY